MRNATVTLSPAAAAIAQENMRTLAAALENGQYVGFTATKRTDGSTSHRTGTVVGFHGDVESSNGSVRVATPTGDRTFNLWLISDLMVYPQA